MNSGVYKLNEVDINSSTIGGKAKNLAILTQNGFSVPFGFVVSTSAFENNNLTKLAIKEIEKLLDDTKFYAVRSSAMVEDAENKSWV